MVFVHHLKKLPDMIKLKAYPLYAMGNFLLL